jgi:hypothetical protein
MEKGPTSNNHISTSMSPLAKILVSEINSFHCLTVMYEALSDQSIIEKMNRSLKIDFFDYLSDYIFCNKYRCYSPYQDGFRINTVRNHIKTPFLFHVG